MFEQITYADPLAQLLALEDEDFDAESLYATNAERTGRTWDSDRDDMLGASPAELAYSMLEG